MPRPNLARRRPKDAQTTGPLVAAGNRSPADGDTRQYLPDFGSWELLRRFVFAALMAAVVVVLSQSASFDAVLSDRNLYVVILALSISFASFMFLKMLSGPISGLSVLSGSLAAFLVIVVVSLVCAEGVHWLAGEISNNEVKHEEHITYLIRTLLITAVVAAFVLRYSIINHRAEVETESQQDDRLQALQSRIRPHFMFNSLNSVASLIRAEPEIAEKALEDLADIFRVMLADARKMVPITTESVLARQYLEIEKIRLGERLSVSWVASNVPRSALIPSLTLQPLVENAVYHGIEPSGNGGMIKVRIWSEGETLQINITNPLPERQNRNHRKGNNMALDNVRERLLGHFGGRANISYGEKEGQYDVSIQLPIVRG